MLNTRKQLQNNDVSQQFVRNATLLVENVYPNTGTQKFQIDKRSCQFAALLMCNNLTKMLFAIYNVDPVTDTQKRCKNSASSS